MGVCLTWMRAVKQYAKRKRTALDHRLGLSCNNTRRTKRRLRSRKNYSMKWVDEMGDKCEGYRMNGGGIQFRMQIAFLHATLMAIESANSTIIDTERRLVRQWLDGITYEWSVSHSEFSTHALPRPTNWDWSATVATFDATWSDLVRGCHLYIFPTDTNGFRFRAPDQVKLIANWLDHIVHDPYFALGNNRAHESDPAFAEDDASFAMEMKHYYRGAAVRGCAVLEQ